MFHNFAEDVAFLLIKNKVIDIERRDIYVYGLEIISLNGSLLIIFLIMSYLSGSMLSFLAYLIFFLPLRSFTGGYHAKTSERCFVLSILMYGAAIAVTERFPFLYLLWGGRLAGLSAVCIMLTAAPLADSNHPLSKRQRKRNKRIVNILVVFDLAFFILCCRHGWVLGSYELVYVLLNTCLLISGSVKWFIRVNEKGKCITIVFHRLYTFYTRYIAVKNG